MSSFVNTVREKLSKTSVASIKYCFDAVLWVEKILWFLIYIFGTLLMIFILIQQIGSWHDNPKLTSQSTLALSDIDFPAVTFCHRGNTRMTVADRLFSALDETSEKSRQMRVLLIKSAVFAYISVFYGTTYLRDTQVIANDFRATCFDLKVDPMCDNYRRIFGYIKAKGVTLKALQDELYQKLFESNDTKVTLVDAMIEIKQSGNSINNVDDYLEDDDQEWFYLQNIEILLDKMSAMPLKMPFSISRTITEQFLNIPKLELDEILKSFKLPQIDLNLMAIGHLYTLNDFEQLGRFDLYINSSNIYLGQVPSNIIQCFEEMHDIYYSQESSHEQSDPEQYVKKKLSFMQPSPCHLSIENCSEYCDFHNKLQSTLERPELLTLMKLSLPQTKVMMGDLNQYELELAKKIFGQKQVLQEGSSLKVSPMALAIYCKDRKDQSWTGDKLTNFKPRLCNDFYATPTDVGICHTKNLNLRKILRKIPEDFSVAFDINEEKARKIEGGNYWGEATFVLDTAAFKQSIFFRRSFESINDRVDKLSMVQMQIQATDELPQILHGINHASSLESITLESGHEYTIEIAPRGQSITDGFKYLTPDDRKCKLETEVESDWFTKYTELNCRYECKIKLAADTCLCVPWDFYHMKSLSECDVFGRTCFFNVIDNVTHSQVDLCPQCIEACERLEYHKISIKSQPLFANKEFGYGKYFSFFAGNYEICKRQDFCAYHLDPNQTLKIPTAFELMLNKSSNNLNADDEHDGMIVVNLRFADPKATMIKLDSRHGLYDRLAGLGGSFGLYTQFTGASFLALLHFCALLIKAIYAHFNENLGG